MMLGKNVNVLFFLKKPKDYHGGKLPIYIRITVNGKSRELSTSRKCDPAMWKQGIGRATGKKEEVRELNEFLEILNIKVYEARRVLIEKNAEVTSESLKSVLTGTDDKAKMILEVFMKHNEQMSALVGTEFAAGTLQRYKTSYDHTKEFIIWKYKVSDLNIKKLDFEFISDYEFWLKSIRKCNHNTTMKYLGNFKKIVIKCIQSGWLEKDPFIGYKMTKREVLRHPLTKDELNRIINKNFCTERLNQVRDIFLFCCFTGLSYVDIKKLKRSEVGVGIDGEKWVFTSRQKEDTPSRIPLLPTTLTILDRYKEHPDCLKKDRVLPVLSNQKMNSYLKEIADVCGINSKITFHLSRHTFATTVTLENGVPIETVSKMLGHKTLKTTQHYAKILDRKVSDDMNILRKKLQ